MDEDKTKKKIGVWNTIFVKSLSPDGHNSRINTNRCFGPWLFGELQSNSAVFDMKEDGVKTHWPRVDGVCHRPRKPQPTGGWRGPLPLPRDHIGNLRGHGSFFVMITDGGKMKT